MDLLGSEKKKIAFGSAMATTQHNEQAELCTCPQCAIDRDFDMPEALLDSCLKGDMVIFAGAGISTEAPWIVDVPLYLKVIAEAEKKFDKLPSFPAAMTAYEEAHGRPAMLACIKEHLDYVRSFPNLDNAAGSFHHELSSLYTVTDIFTTNWDDYFERCCGAQPYVTEADWAFWKTHERKVFKLHGSLSSPGSIVATEADYRKCYRNLNQGLIGAQLKTLLATKTVVFVGYSLRDSDFVSVYRLLKRKMGDLMPRAYFVSPRDGESPDIAKDMHILRTSGMHFVRMLKKEFPEDELIPDSHFALTPYVRRFVWKAHHDLLDTGEMREDPAMYICACYQDGLMDAFDHQMANAAKGPYHHRCYVEGLIHVTYDALRQERMEEGIWHTVAYIQGYMNGLQFLLVDPEDRKQMPLYYLHDGHDDLQTYEDYAKVAKRFESDRPEIFEFAKADAEKLGPGIVFQHLPSL